MYHIFKFKERVIEYMLTQNIKISDNQFRFTLTAIDDRDCSFVSTYRTILKKK